MNPNEIKKALEFCTNRTVPSVGCPFEKDNFCGRKILQGSLAYINRLEAEVKRVETAYPKTFESIKKIYATAKSSAIKEFGKFLIDKSVDGVISVADLPEYVIEMVGDDG